MESHLHAGGGDGLKVFLATTCAIFLLEPYKAYRDIVKLADVLGHSSLETTRIYLVSTGAEHSRALGGWA